MAYCDIDDLKDNISETELIQLTDDANADVVDTDIITAMIEYADELIDGYLRGRYATPLSPIPDMIKSLSVDLAIYRLFWRRSKNQISDSMKDIYKQSIETLKGIQKGVIVLNIPDEGGPDTGDREIKTNKTSSSRLFDSDLLDQY